MDGGYVKLHRKIIISSIWGDPNKLKLWIYCIVKASHKEREVSIGNQSILIKEGQFITGRNTLEREFNNGSTGKNIVSGITLFRYFELFEKLGMLNIEKSNKYTLISIINWNKYQLDEQILNNRCTQTRMEKNILNTYVQNEAQICANESLDKEKYFEEFWKLYPNKKDKKKAKQKFFKVCTNEEIFNKIMSGLKKQIESLDWKKDGGRYIPMPSTWINGERWEDELQTDIPSNTSNNPYDNLDYL